MRPLIGTGNGDEVREMTDEEYAELLASDWTATTETTDDE